MDKEAQEKILENFTRNLISSQKDMPADFARIADQMVREQVGNAPKKHRFGKKKK